MLDEASVVAFLAVRPKIEHQQVMPALLVSLGTAQLGNALPELGDRITRQYLARGFELIAPPAADWSPRQLGPVSASHVSGELAVTVSDAQRQHTLYQGAVDFPDHWRDVAHALSWCGVYVMTGVDVLRVDDLDLYARTGRLVAAAAAFTDFERIDAGASGGGGETRR